MKVIISLCIFFLSFSCIKTEFKQKIDTEVPIYKLLYFYSPDCGICEEIKEKILPSIEKEMRIKFSVEYFNIEEEENFRKVLFLETKTGIKNPGFPVIFIGNTSLYGEDEIKIKLKSVLEYIIKNKIDPFQPEKWLAEYKSSDKKDFTSEAIKKLSFIPVIISGLLDGVNPCAFSTLIFLISFLFFVKIEKRTILFIGIFYTLGVFLTYLFAGIGAFKLLKTLTTYKIIAYIIKYLSIIFLGLITILSKKSDFFLKMPDKLKQKIHEIIRNRAKKMTFFLSSFIIGVILSFFELACTGQIYLPTILYIIQVPSLRLKGLGYLILYNLMFILPLIGVFLITWLGVTSKTIETFFKKNLLLLKFLMTFVFAFLFIVVIFQH